MINIRVGDLYSTLHAVDPGALRIVRNVCRARPKGYIYMDKYRKGYWDGYISVMNSINSFPSGLLSLVVKALEHHEYELEIESSNTHVEFPKIAENLLNGITLRKYQIKAVTALLGAQRGVAKMATNSGKTEVIMSAMLQVGFDTYKQDFQAIVIVHRKELLHQTAARIADRTGLDVGMIGDGIWNVGRVTVAMVQTLASKKKYDEFENNIFVFIDECHHASSVQMLDVLLEIPGSYRYGFSGTPLKYDKLSDLKLIAATGDVVCDVSNEYLISRGYSAKPIVQLHIVENVSETLWDAIYQDAYSDCIVNGNARNRCIVSIARKSEGITLILVNRIDHGTLLCDALPGSIFVHGSNTMEERQAVLDMMRDETPGVYIASPIFEEGVDVPAIDTIILAGGGKSNVNLLQRIGRGLRKKENGNILIVHDFIDDTNRHLLKHSDYRIKIYEEEGFEHSIV